MKSLVSNCLCLSCGEVKEKPLVENGYCLCGADNFVQAGDTVWLSNGYIRAVKEIVNADEIGLGEWGMCSYKQIQIVCRHKPDTFKEQTL